MIDSDSYEGIELSIIIVNWNNGELTRLCVESVRENITNISYEIIVVDNGSDLLNLETIYECQKIYDFTVISLCQNMFFGEANNIAVERASGRKVLLLNNDVTLVPNCIEALIEVLNSAYLAGAVGPKFLYPDGRLQEAGAFVRPDGWTVQHGKRDQPADLISGEGRHIVDYCSAACLLMRRDDFLRLGGFDPLFDPAYFEDVDLMFRMRSLGLFTYLCADVAVFHQENTTSDAIWRQEQRNKVVAGSHQTFVARWGTYVADRIFKGGAMPVAASHDWSPAPPLLQDRAVVILHGPGLIRAIPEWISAVRLAGNFVDNDHVIFAADEACSRCRIYSIAAQNNVRLGDFSVMRHSEISSLICEVALHVQVKSGQTPIIIEGKRAHRDRAEVAIISSV